MEKDIAIMMADLSGYTALTETHGAFAAADLIDRYVGIVEACLVGDCEIHERTGDEIMVVSSSADSMFATASTIALHTSTEENFLQVHGGLHYGKVLKRGKSYFGSAINLTSRIAAKARAGSFWCSEEAVKALTDLSLFPIESKGRHAFKNVSEPREVFELCLNDNQHFSIDPVCRMLILNKQKAVWHPDHADEYFCSANCLELYVKQVKSPK